MQKRALTHALAVPKIFPAQGVVVLEKWSELRTVLYVAEHGSVSAAAAALGYHRATVNRHVDALETEVGARIFFRHAQGYDLTEIGEEVVRVAQTTQGLTGGLLQRIHEQTGQIEGEVRITLLAPFAGLIMDAVTSFANTNPNCRVFIDSSERPLRLEHAEAHIAIRVGRKPKHPDYVVQSLGLAPMNLYGHQSYLERFGVPRSVNDMSGHRFIVPPDNKRNFPFWPWIAMHVRPQSIVLASGDIWVMVKAITQGVGLGFLGVHEAQAYQDLHPILPESRAWSAKLWLVTHVDVHRTRKVQAMVKCIKTAFEDA